MTTAQLHIADTLDRAQNCWNLSLAPDTERDRRHRAISLFVGHITTAVLLEHIRRLDPALADRLVPWLLSEDGIFCDGYAGELLFEWRQQVAAGQLMDPIAPQPGEVRE